MSAMILAFISGSLMVLIFPNFRLYLLAYVALVPLLIAIRRSRSVLEAIICGEICGLVFFGGILFWVNVLSKWAGAWAVLAWISLAVFQSLFVAAFAGVSKYSMKKAPWLNLITIPFAWTAIEWLRSLGPYGVTGGGLGYSQADFLPVIQIAYIAGVYAISFLIVFFNEALVESFLERKDWTFGIAIMVLTAVLVFGFYRIDMFRIEGKPIDVAIIQGNIPQDVKLDYSRAGEIVSLHELMSKKAALLKPDIIIWPETSVTTYLFDTSSLLSRIRSLVAGSNAYYLIGTPFRDKSSIYNSLVAFSKKGEYIGRYDKQRLVPFGEYLPLRPITYRMLGENPMFAEDYNSDPHPKLLDLGIARVGAVICFESTFPYLVRDLAKKGAQFLLVVTNDAWFFDSAAPYQHIQSAQVRAVENGMYVVQAANTGVSAIIDPLGRVIKRSNVGEAAVLQGRIFIH